MNTKHLAAVAVAVTFAAAGIAVGCVDLRDHLTVEPTATPNVEILQPSPEPLTITEAKREVEVVVDSTARWVEWREQDIAKREQLVAFIEGFTASGLTAVSESAGTWAGPFAPLVTLGLGYLIKRRGDKTPEDYRKAKEDSYNAGLEFGKTLAEAAKQA